VDKVGLVNDSLLQLWRSLLSNVAGVMVPIEAMQPPSVRALDELEDRPFVQTSVGL
jgi:hypothetical protein